MYNKELCEEIKRGDSYHLGRIDSAISVLAQTAPQPSPTPQADSQPAKVELFNPLEGGNLETELQMAAVIALRDSQPALPEITAEDRSFLHYNPNTDDVVDWVHHYARAAIAADRAARPKAVPLTDEQIVGVMHSIPINAAPSYHIAFARAIEAGHGIQGGHHDIE